MIRQLLIDGTNEQGLDLSIEQIGQLESMLDMLNEWNQKHNLTSIRDLKDQCIYHVLDSLSAHRFFQPHAVIADLGTGAGFPGIPLSICFPEKHIYLVESNGKKVAYLKYLKAKLSLEHVTICHSRIEDLQLDHLDAITARALSKPEQLINLSQHLCQDSTQYILYVGALCPRLPHAKTDEVLVPGSVRKHYVMKVQCSEL